MSLEFRAFGKRITEPSKELDTFPKPASVKLVTFTTDELTSYCPVTGQPDFNTVEIVYEPDEVCVESKSLKLYLWTFRDEPIFGEGLAHTIAQDLFDALNPLRCTITLTQGIRGGLEMTAVAEVVREA